MAVEADPRTVMWERRAAFVASVGLTVSLLTALVGYIGLLAFDRSTGTLDNLASLAIGAVAGVAGSSAANAIATRRAADAAPANDSEEFAPAPIKWPPDIPDEVVGL